MKLAIVFSAIRWEVETNANTLYILYSVRDPAKLSSLPCIRIDALPINVISKNVYICSYVYLYTWTAPESINSHQYIHMTQRRHVRAANQLNQIYINQWLYRWNGHPKLLCVGSVYACMCAFVCQCGVDENALHALYGVIIVIRWGNVVLALCDVGGWIVGGGGWIVGVLCGLVRQAVHISESLEQEGEGHRAWTLSAQWHWIQMLGIYCDLAVVPQRYC